MSSVFRSVGPVSVVAAVLSSVATSRLFQVVFGGQVFHVVAEHCSVAPGMGSPSRLEEGWSRLPGDLPGCGLNACSFGIGCAGEGCGGKGAGGSEGLADAWAAARQTRLPDTPFSTPSRNTGSNQQQERPTDPWGSYTGARGHTGDVGGQQPFHYLYPGQQVSSQQQMFQGVGGQVVGAGYPMTPGSGCQVGQQMGLGTGMSQFACTPTPQARTVPIEQSTVAEMSQLRSMMFSLQQNVQQLFSLLSQSNQVAAAPFATFGSGTGNAGESVGQGSSGQKGVATTAVSPGLPLGPSGSVFQNGQSSQFGQQYGHEAHRSPRPPFGQANLGGDQQNFAGLDALSKTEKWLPGLPKCPHETWKDRESEIAGFHDYLGELRTWASLVSPQFAAEIAAASTMTTEIVLAALSREQQSRAGRLLSILRSAFAGHGRAEIIIRAFCEGVSFGHNPTLGMAFSDNGYELLRVLTKEFTLQSRAEALALRSELLQRQFAPSKGETTQGTIVADTIRHLETSLARYNKLVSTLPGGVDRAGVEITEADRLVLLLRSLPTACAEFVLLHSAQETYQTARETACRYESQRRLYLDWSSFGKAGKLLHEVQKPDTFDLSEMDGYDEAWIEYVGNDARCLKCGSKKHTAQNCIVDLTKTRCFKCGGFGHVSMNCKNQGSTGKNWQKGSTSNSLKGKEKGREKGKGSKQEKGKKGKGSKGKESKTKGKGKMFEVASPEDAWWGYDEWYEDEAWPDWDWAEPEQEGSPHGGGDEDAEPVASALIAGMFIGVGSTRFALEVNETTNETQEESDVCCIDFDRLSGAERISMLNMCEFSLFPLCFRVHVTLCDMKLDQVLGPYVDVKCTCVFANVFSWMFEEHFLSSDVLFLECSSYESTSNTSFLETISVPRMSAETDSTDFDMQRIDVRALEAEFKKIPLTLYSVVSSLLCLLVWLFVRYRFETTGFWKMLTMGPSFRFVFVVFLSMCCLSFVHGIPSLDFHEEEQALNPLLYEMQRVENGFWLLDSGAAATVVSSETYQRFKECQQATELKTCAQAFYAANGSSVGVLGETQLSGYVLTECHGAIQPQKMVVHAVVGRTQHDILSINQCVGRGWSFTFSGSVQQMLHEESKSKVATIVTWAGCPWIVFVPTLHELHQMNAQPLQQETTTMMSPIQLNTPSEAELLAHKLRGHTPYMPWCVHCQKSKGVTHHRRRSADEKLQIVLAADFFYIDDLKGLALSERASGAIGAIVMTGDVTKDRANLVHWLAEMGLTAQDGGVAIQLCTDSEAAVSSFVTGATSAMNWTVERASPQGHEHVGAAERAVRTVKEGIAVIRSELTEHGLELKLSEQSFADVLRHVCHSRNLFSHAHGGDRTPKELVAGSKMKEQMFAPFLSRILAEVPQSIKDKYPTVSRFVDAIYIAPVWTSVGSEVIGEVSANGIIQYVRFNAKSFKHVLPLSWTAKFYQDLHSLSTQEHSHQPTGHDVPRRQVIPSTGPSLRCPVSGPPSAWINTEGGYTDNCIACRGLKERGSRKGLVHSKNCCRRYETFLKDKAEETRKESSEPIETPVQAREPAVARSSVHFEDTVDPGSYEPTEPPEEKEQEENEIEIEREENEEQSERERHNKRLSLKDVEETLERPVRRRMIEKGPDQTGAFQDHPPSTSAESRSRGLKRPSEMDLKELEEELKKDDIESIQIETKHWCATFVSLASVVSSPPSMSSEHMLSSVRFASDGKVPKSFVVMMGGMPIKIWCPSDAVDDNTGDVLDGEKCHLGMKKEIEGLEECKAGDCYTVSGFEKLRAESDFPIRLISTRWVTVAKGDEVRSRMVVKDVRSKESARSLGISSPTLGTDSFQLFLTMSAAWNMLVYTLDISHAFMYTPLRRRDVAVRLPMSCSTETGEPVILHCANALNGLRSASLEWLLFLQQQLGHIGLQSDGAEPCFMAGKLPSGRIGMVIVYVDDLAVSCEHEDDFKVILGCLQKKLKVKQTGTISREGGRVTFLGREIVRLPGDVALYVHVPETYMVKTFEAWGFKQMDQCTGGKRHPCPNILAILDQESAGSPELTGEAYQRFRSTLGKISWLAQTRQDLKHYVALLGTVQSSPTQAAEKALRALVRFMTTDVRMSLRIPSEDSGFVPLSFQELTAFTDASHAPSTRNRRGVLGGILAYLGGLVKAYSRHQTSMSLSSCEAELQGIQQVLQEAVVVARLLTRILRSLEYLDKSELVMAKVYSDSESALKLIRAIDLPRRSRHISIKIEWIRELIEQGHAELIYLRGESLPADSLTKCLSTERFLRLRSIMGFVDMPLIDALMSLRHQVRQEKFAFLEVCCDENSQLKQVCASWNIPYRGVTYGVEMRSTFTQAKAWAESLGNVSLHVHLSTMCTSGSPLRRFAMSSDVREMDATWDEHIAGATSFLKLGNTSSFELPLANDIWGRWFVQKMLTKFNHECQAIVHLCQTGLKGSDQKFVGKRLRFTTNTQTLSDHLHQKFGTCRCSQGHANFNFVSWKKTALYNRKLAEEIVKGAQKSYQK